MFTFAHTIRATAAPTLQHSIARRPLRTYFLLAYALMWLPVLPMTLSRNLGVGLLPYDLPDVVGLLLYLMASFSGPTVAALIVTGATEGRAGVRRLLTRCIQ